MHVLMIFYKRIQSPCLKCKNLSKVVLKHFKPMIPNSFHQLWQEGIETNDYYLKLCGSGGGGYILGFAQDFEKAKKTLKNHKLELVYRF